MRLGVHSAHHELDMSHVLPHGLSRSYLPKHQTVLVALGAFFDYCEVGAVVENGKSFGVQQLTCSKDPCALGAGRSLLARRREEGFLVWTNMQDIATVHPSREELVVDAFAKLWRQAKEMTDIRLGGPDIGHGESREREERRKAELGRGRATIQFFVRKEKEKERICFKPDVAVALQRQFCTTQRAACDSIYCPLRSHDAFHTKHCRPSNLSVPPQQSRQPHDTIFLNDRTSMPRKDDKQIGWPKEW